MKIAVVFDNMIYGGIEKVGIDHIKLLKKLGHEVDAYVLIPKTEPIIEELKAVCNVKIVSLPRNCCPEAYWVLTRRWKAGKFIFPIVYLITKCRLFFYKIFKTQKKKYDIAIAFAGHYNDLTFVANNFIKASKKIAWLHGALYQYVLISQGFENLYKKIKNLVVLVDDGQEEVLAYHKKDGFNFNIHKIYNPISMCSKKINPLTVNELKEKYGDFLIMVSRLLYPHKDHYTVIRAIAILKEKYGFNNKLLIVGDGPEHDKLIKFVSDLNLADQVIFAGSQSDVQNYYSAAKLLVHASVAGEGLPTVILEAMDMGLPVVCTDSKVGPREVLGNNDFGLLTKVQDENDMADKIHLILNDSNLYEKYVKLGRERILDFYPDKISKQLDALMKNL